MITPSGGDDTAIIQAELNSKNYVELDRGTFLVSSLNLTDRQGTAIIGKGSLNTKLQGTQNGANIVDCTGTSNALLRDLMIYGPGSGVMPNTGILTAQRQGTASADVFAAEGVRVDGSYGIASFFCHGVESSRLIGCQFYNYAGMTGVFTGNNFFGATSAFVPISTANDMQPSDWTIVATEWHNMANGWALWLGGIDSFRFIGGNVSSAAPMVTNNAVQMAQGVMYPSHNFFEGTTFYSDYPPPAPYAVSGLTSGEYISFPYCRAHGMPLTGP